MVFQKSRRGVEIMTEKKWSFKEEIKRRNIVQMTELEKANEIMKCLVFQGRTIQAIKFLQDLMAWDLAKSKKYVEELENVHKFEKTWKDFDSIDLREVHQLIDDQRFASAVMKYSKITNKDYLKAVDDLQEKFIDSKTKSASIKLHL